MLRSLLVVLLFLPQLAVAQYPYGRGRPHVVKDNVKCLYGLKNDSNEWIVPPQYTTLNDERTYFLPGNSQSKFGLINTRGQLILPVEYDRIRPVAHHRFAPDLFIVNKNEKYGIVDSSGKEFLPMIYDHVDYVYLAVYPHRYFVLKKGNEFALIDNTQKYFIPFSENILSSENYIHLKLRIIDKEGRHGLVDSTGIIIPPRYKSLISLEPHVQVFPDYFIAEDIVSGRKGLINSHGDTLLPFKNASISVNAHINRSKRIVVADEHERRFGVYDSSMHVIIPEGTKYISSGYNNHIPSQPTDTCPVRRDEKWGLMSGNGDWVTKQMYDTIIYPDFAADNSRGHFIVRANGKYGVIDPAGKLKIPVEYDMLVQCSDKHTSSGGSGCVRTVNTYGTFFFVGKKNGYYGATNSDGSNFVPYIYDTIFNGYELNSWYNREMPGAQYGNGDLYFTTRDKALFLQRGRDSDYYFSYAASSQTYTLSYFFTVNGTVKVYKSANGYFPFREIKAGNKTVLAPARDVNVSIDRNNSDQLEVRPGYYEDLLYFDRKTGKQIVNPLDGVQLVARAGENHIFQSKQNTLGIISPQGKVLLKPAYMGLAYVTAFGGKEYLWTKMSEDTSCGSYDPKSNCACGWRLCNMNGVPVSPYVFDFPQSLSQEVVPIVIDGKIGLFNVQKLKFVSAVVYKDISSFCRNIYSMNDYDGCYAPIFYVMRFNGQFGIMDGTGKWLTDSTYDYMIPYPRRNSMAAMTSTMDEFTFSRWLLVGPDSEVMVDAHGKIARDSVLIDSLLVQSYHMTLNMWAHLSGGGYREPEYYQKGPQVGYRFNRQLKVGEQVNYEQDSAYLAALETGNEIIMNLFGYRCHRTPGSYSIGGTGYVMGDWGAFESNGYLRTVQPREAEHLKADIIHYSDNAISIQALFNPDTSAAGKNNPYPYYLNFQKTESGEYIPLTLDSIFCSTVQYQFVLNKLIREAVKKRDDLNIDCGNEDAFFARTQGKFYLSDTGLVFDLRTAFIGIPWKQLQPFSRPGGIVDRYIGNSNGEHCRPAYDTTAIDNAAQGIVSMKNLQVSGYLSREKITMWHYLFTDSANHIVNGIRYCNGSDMVIDVFFEPVVVKNAKGGTSAYTDDAKLPRAIRKKTIVNFYSIKHYPCVR